MWRHRASEKMAFLLFAGFGLNFLPQLNVKAANNFKPKSSGIILTRWAVFVPVFAFLLFLVSQVVCGEVCALFAVLGLF